MRMNSGRLTKPDTKTCSNFLLLSRILSSKSLFPPTSSPSSSHTWSYPFDYILWARWDEFFIVWAWVAFSALSTLLFFTYFRVWLTSASSSGTWFWPSPPFLISMLSFSVNSLFFLTYFLFGLTSTTLSTSRAVESYFGFLIYSHSGMGKSIITSWRIRPGWSFMLATKIQVRSMDRYRGKNLELVKKPKFEAGNSWAECAKNWMK